MRDPAEQFEHLRAALASRYRIVREAGHGGMATVYLAEDLKHDRRVAVKVLRPELAAALGPERFLREIQIAAVLAHPHILPLHDSGEADGFVFYVMPYVEGETLRDRLVRQRQLPVGEAVRIVQEVADGLGYAHNLGVVHRDIKPENILFMGGHAVVTDFGVATAVGSAGSARLTESGISVGTPLYMSPEQAMGQGDVDGRSDTYSLACVLYEMLAGEPPFGASSAQAVLAKKLSEPVPRLSSLRETVSLALEEAIRRGLARIPADRFGTTTEFASAAAEAATSDRPAEPAAGQTGRPGVRVHARRRVAWAVPLLAGVLAVALGGTVWLLRVGDRGGTTQRPAGTSDGEAQRPTVIAVLPFENLGPAEDEYFAAGMTDEITSRLGAVSGLGLVPSRAVQRYARTSMTMREIGRELGIDYLLVGSVRWAGADSTSRSVRITLELLRAQDERQLWATTYDREITDIFAVQSDIAEHVIERLGVTLLEGEEDYALVGYEYLARREVSSLRGHRIPLRSSAYAQRVIESDAPVSHSDIRELEQDELIKLYVRLDVCAVLAAPVVVHGMRRGLIELHINCDPHEWTEDDAKLLGTVAAQVSVAKTNMPPPPFAARKSRVVCWLGQVHVPASRSS